MVKNYFYSSIRRQLRKLLRKYGNDKKAEPNEINIEFLMKFIKDNKIPYSAIDNENIRDLIIHCDKRKNRFLNDPQPIISKGMKSSWYFFI